MQWCPTSIRDLKNGVNTFQFENKSLLHLPKIIWPAAISCDTSQLVWTINIIILLMIAICF